MSDLSMEKKENEGECEEITTYPEKIEKEDNGRGTTILSGGKGRVLN